jgi:hypothetical protein
MRGWAGGARGYDRAVRVQARDRTEVLRVLEE